jgi:hypothetical protein
LIRIKLQHKLNMSILSVAIGWGAGEAADDTGLATLKGGSTPMVILDDRWSYIHDIGIGDVFGAGILAEGTRDEFHDVQGGRGSIAVGGLFEVEHVGMVRDLQLASVGSSRNLEVDKLEIVLRLALCPLDVLEADMRRIEESAKRSICLGWLHD